jgi:hypothetical protein
MKKRIVISVFVLLILVGSFFFGQSIFAEKKADISSLRIEYPYSKNNPLIDRAVFQSLDESPLLTVFNALVEVRVCGELIEKSWGMYMTESQEDRSTITAYYIPVKITKIISTKGDFSFINEEEFILCYTQNAFYEKVYLNTELNLYVL